MPRAMSNQSTFVANLGENEIDGVFTQDRMLGANTGEQISPTSRQLMQFTQGSQQMCRKRNDMSFAHLHLDGRNDPQGLVEINLDPLGVTHHARPACCP
jgi:hypothetical protein